MTAFPTSAGCSPSAKRTGLIHHHWHENTAVVCKDLLETPLETGRSLELWVWRNDLGRRVSDQFTFFLRARPAPVGVGFDLEFHIVCEGVVVGRFYSNAGAER